MKVIDLFAGCGGLSLGFFRDGYKVVRAVEIDPAIAETYRRNHPQTQVLVEDIRQIDRSELFTRGDAQVIIGGPPCQGFSMAGARIRGGFIDDPRNYLFKHYVQIVRTVRPKLFIMENVKGIATMQGGKIFEEIIRTFSDPEQMEGHPYVIYPRLVRAVEFGIPQKRERMLLIGVDGGEIDMEAAWEETGRRILSEEPDFFDPVTVRDAIGNLPDAVPDGQIENPRPQTAYQRYLSSGEPYLYNHSQTRHSDTAVSRMERVQSGENFRVLDEAIHSVHSGAYGRLSWDQPAPTVTTRFDTPAGGRFIHPEKNRTLTPREAARIQSFPDDFIFYGSKTSVCRQIGNAVPPKISYFLAKLTRVILEKQEGSTPEVRNHTP